MTITARQHMGTYQVTHSVKVPVCRACKRFLERIPVLVGVVTVLAFIAISFGNAPWSKDAGIVGKILGGGFIGALVGAVLAYFTDKLLAPARLDPGGHIEFQQELYQKLFEGKLPLEAAPTLHDLAQSPKCDRCGQVYPSQLYIKLFRTAEGITSICTSCYEGLAGPEKRAIGTPLQS